MDYHTALARLAKQITAAGAARRLGVSERTVRRWLIGQTRPYAYLQRLIVLEAAFSFGELSALDTSGAWHGWRVAADGLLYDPAGNAYSPGDVVAAGFMRLNGVRRAAR